MARADVLARDYLNSYGLLATPIDPAALAEKLGIVVARTPTSADITAAASGSIDDDMVTIRISGMHCRSLVRWVADLFPCASLGDGPVRRESA